jgi:hypothetical protein
MELFNSRPEKRNWLRFAMKLGLIATDAAVWASLNRVLSDREDVRSSAHPRDRMAVELNRRGWSHTTTLLTGIGIGLGLGITFAPMPGEQARIAIRDTARNIKTKVDDVAGWARWGSTSAHRRSTGTYAD